MLTDLQYAADGTGNEGPIWTESCSRDRALERESVQKRLSLLVDYDGLAIVVNCKHKGAIRAQGEGTDLQISAHAVGRSRVVPHSCSHLMDKGTHTTFPVTVPTTAYMLATAVSLPYAKAAPA